MSIDVHKFRGANSKSDSTHSVSISREIWHRHLTPPPSLSPEMSTCPRFPSLLSSIFASTDGLWPETWSWLRMLSNSLSLRRSISTLISASLVVSLICRRRVLEYSHFISFPHQGTFRSQLDKPSLFFWCKKSCRKSWTCSLVLDCLK